MNTNRKQASVDVNTLKAELENVMPKMAELNSDYSKLQLRYAKLSNKLKHSSG